MKILPDYQIDHNYNFYVSGYGFRGDGFGNGFYGDGFGDGRGCYYYTWNYPMWDVHDINLIILQ
jgi:hypothetical protein